MALPGRVNVVSGGDDAEQGIEDDERRRGTEAPAQLSTAGGWPFLAPSFTGRGRRLDAALCLVHASGQPDHLTRSCRT